MPQLKVIWTERALNDLFEIKAFISKDSVIQANKQLERILSRESQLAARPNSGAIQQYIQSEFQIRYLVQDNYKVLYRQTETEVYILTVFDTRQDPGKLKL